MSKKLEDCFSIIDYFEKTIRWKENPLQVPLAEFSTKLWEIIQEYEKNKEIFHKYGLRDPGIIGIIRFIESYDYTEHYEKIPYKVYELITEQMYKQGIGFVSSLYAAIFESYINEFRR